MAFVFAKLAPDLHRHPKIRKAGRDGRDVFVFCLCVNADRGATGIIPADYLDPEFLRETLQMDSAEQAAAGLARAVAAKLIELRPDASGRLVGWDDEEWGRARGGSMTEAERAQIKRDRKKTAAPPEEIREVAGVRTQRPDASGRPDQSESDAESESESGSLSVDARAEGESPTELVGPLLEHAVVALNAARAKIDPAHEPIHPNEIHAASGRGLRDRLREVTPPADRRRKLDFAIAVLAARAAAAGVADDLRLGYLGGEKSWSQLLAGSVKGAGAVRARAGPPPSVGRAAPAVSHGTGSTDPRTITPRKP